MFVSFFLSFSPKKKKKKKKKQGKKRLDRSAKDISITIKVARLALVQMSSDDGDRNNNNNNSSSSNDNAAAACSSKKLNRKTPLRYHSLGHQQGAAASASTSASSMASFTHTRSDDCESIRRRLERALEEQQQQR